MIKHIYLFGNKCMLWIGNLMNPPYFFKVFVDLLPIAMKEINLYDISSFKYQQGKPVATSIYKITLFWKLIFSIPRGIGWGLSLTLYYKYAKNLLSYWSDLLILRRLGFELWICWTSIITFHNSVFTMLGGLAAHCSPELDESAVGVFGSSLHVR